MGSKIRLDIALREPFADGMSFGSVGAYERLAGKAHFSIDPGDPSNLSIVDLENAPRNDQGLVEYSTDLFILKPVDLAKGNRRLIYDVNNRGNLRILQFFNDAVHSNQPSNSDHAGNGFLMREGYSIVCSGWQGDLLPGDERFTMDLPTATDDGDEIAGITRMEFIAESPGVTCTPLSGNDYTRSYETASLDTESAAFTMREYERDTRQPIEPSRWRFASLNAEGSDAPSSNHCFLPEGFKPGWIYELVYTTKNPPVLGLGFTGVRDLISFLMHGSIDSDGTPNPLLENGVSMEKAYAWGRSQSGRFLRDLVYQGFNVDSEDRQVFDAVSPHVAGGGRIVLNCRFAQPGRYPRQHFDHLYPCDQFPFSYATTTDPHTGKTDGILKRPDTDPLIMHTQTSAEYWERRGSLAHTDALGNDIEEPENVRFYMFTGSQHSADPLGGPDYESFRHPSNAHNVTPLLRALLAALDEWATLGKKPPDSLVPRRSEETAVPADVVKSNFPAIPNVESPTEPNLLHLQNHGAAYDDGIMAKEPPEVDQSKEYAVLVPQVGADGNEIAGVRSPQIEVPLATYTGWNFRTEGSAEKALSGLTGSYLPFASTKAERESAGDTRASIEELYQSKAEYVDMISNAAQKLVSQRLLLEEDADRYIEIAKAEILFDQS